MKRLWILRHAKSSWDHPGVPDHDRPLAPRGRKAARRIARWAGANGVRPELVLCSTALRARSTLDLVRAGIGGPDERVERGLYHASTDDVLELLASTPDDLTEVMLIGHNPTLHDLAAALAPPGPDAFPTGALVAVGLAIDSWEEIRPGCGQIESFVVPRSLAP